MAVNLLKVYSNGAPYHIQFKMSITADFRGAEFNSMVMRGGITAGSRTPLDLEPVVIPFPENKKMKNQAAVMLAAALTPTPRSPRCLWPHHTARACAPTLVFVELACHHRRRGGGRGWRGAGGGGDGDGGKEEAVETSGMR